MKDDDGEDEGDTGSDEGDNDDSDFDEKYPAGLQAHQIAQAVNSGRRINFCAFLCQISHIIINNNQSINQ